MKTKKVNVAHVWKQMEDVVVPRMRLSLVERAVYSYLLRHSRLEGKARLRFSMAWLGYGTCLTEGPVRDAVRRLADEGVLRLVDRSKAGHVVEVRLPGEIRAARLPDENGRPGEPRLGESMSLAEADCMQNKALRQAIHLREDGQCFYCLRRLTAAVRCLDHVVPRAQSGKNSYRNLVSCCLECNSEKGERPAQDYLRRLYRERRLTTAEFAGRLRALEVLASGKLRPVLESEGRSRAARRLRTRADRAAHRASLPVRVKGNRGDPWASF